MTDPAAARSFLLSEVEALEPFAFLAVLPNGRPAHLVEVTRLENGGLELRIPGRPRGAPELEPSVHTALQARGFASENPEDSSKPWACPVADAEASVALALELLVEVFGEKPDATLDVGHGSHRTEHEARQRLEVARGRIEPIVADILGRPAERDEDGDYLLPIGEVRVTVAPRAALDAQVLVRVFAITNVGFTVAPELGLFLARLNFGLMFGRFALDAEHGAIWFDETLLGEQFREEELRFAIHMVASTADGWDDRLKEMFGGVTYQEALEAHNPESLPPTKPGEGVGQYL